MSVHPICQISEITPDEVRKLQKGFIDLLFCLDLSYEDIVGFAAPDERPLHPDSLRRLAETDPPSCHLGDALQLAIVVAACLGIGWERSRQDVADLQEQLRWRDPNEELPDPDGLVFIKYPDGTIYVGNASDNDNLSSEFQWRPIPI